MYATHALPERRRIVASWFTVLAILFFFVTVARGIELPEGNETKPEGPDKERLNDTTGGVTGTMTYGGAAPAPLAFPPAAGFPAIQEESLLVDPKTNGIQNVVIFLERAPLGVGALPPPAPIPFLIRGATFSPHILIVRTGQTVNVTNVDPAMRSFHSHPLRNGAGNLALPAAAPPVPIVYNSREKLPFPVRSDLHPWMKAYHLVLDHPFAAVTDSKGRFKIKGLPPGNYEFVVWHELAGYLERRLNVAVVAGKTATLDLKFPAAKFAP